MNWKNIVELSNKIHKETIKYPSSWLCLPLTVSKNLLGLLGMEIGPVPGHDAQWIGFCKNCSENTEGTDDMTLQVSVGGFYNGGVVHCYSCGTEKEIKGFRNEDIERLKTSCENHWKKYPIIPYNWHTLNEIEKFKTLGINNGNQ